MGKEHVLVVGPYPAWDMRALEDMYEVHKLWLSPHADNLLGDVGASIRAIATRGELGASAALMAKLPRLEIVSCYGVGTDAIDLAYARSHSIAITNTPDVLTEDVADLGVGLLLAVARNIPAGDTHVRSGAWAASNMELTTRVSGKRVGIVGLGKIGMAFARRMGAFGCDISYWGRRQYDDVPYRFVGNLVALAQASDILVVTLAGGSATRGLIDAATLEALGSHGILVNISRGSVVDEPALIEALERKRILGAGLDVFLNEPAIDSRFGKLSNVVLQPHHGSGTIETRRAMGQLLRDNLAAHFAGRPLLTPVA